MKCKICNKELKRIGLKHLWTEKCLKITNDLWYEIDLIKQKEERNEFINDYDSYIKMKLKYKELTEWRSFMEENRY